MAYGGAALYDPRPGAAFERRRLGFLGKLLAFVFLDKRTRDKLARRPNADTAPPRSEARAATPERERLIAEAMKLVEQKQEVLADLSEEERRDLIATLSRKDPGKRE